jgi:putative protease
LNLGEHLKALIEAGITSFKIEGRLKDQYYVANAVSYLRRQLDSLLPSLNLLKSSSGQSIPRFTPVPAKTFNRGFTSYFLFGRRQPLGAFATPKMQGEPVGTVVKVRGRKLQLATSTILHPGDGVTFYNESGVLCGAAVNAVSAQIVELNKCEGIKPGSCLYRNFDHAFITALKKAPCQRVIPVRWYVKKEGNALCIRVQDEEENSAALRLESPAIQAKQPAQMLTTIKKQLHKTGNTEFQTTSVEIEPGCSFFLTLAELNALRRRLLIQLAEVRLVHTPPSFVNPAATLPAADRPYPEVRLSYAGNVLNQKALEFLTRLGVKEIEPAAETGRVLQGKKVMTCRMCIKYELGWCRKYPREQTVTAPGPDAEPFYLQDETGHKLKLVFNCQDCVMEVFLV